MSESLFQLLTNHKINSQKFNQKSINIKINENNETFNTYLVFNGILLSFIHKETYGKSKHYTHNDSSQKILEINHCYSGSYMYQTDNNRINYFEKGDLCISTYDLKKSKSEFPLGYYEGLEILIDIDVANEFISDYIPDFDLIEFYKQLSSGQGYLLIKNNQQIDHIVSEIYRVNNKIRDTYFKLKILELLLFFSITDFEDEIPHKISAHNLYVIKQVKEFLISDLKQKITIEELSEKYSISPTNLKKYFREIYGKPIFRWLTEYKIDYACKLINEGRYNLSEISEIIGYKNPSNFTKSFKKYKGCSPSQYGKY